MAKIAEQPELATPERAPDDAEDKTARRVLARGEGWSVAEILCTSGPRDRPIDEQHPQVCIAMVTAGTFQYRSAQGRELMTPGSLLLGNAGQDFECGHEHGTGDRCIAFWYSPEYFESLVADALEGSARPSFPICRIPPLRELSPAFAQAVATAAGRPETLWEELSVRLASDSIRLANGLPSQPANDTPAAVARVTRVIRAIERDPAGLLSIETLAAEARLSPYHFLRTFESLAGVTPHQYLLRMRLRQAAMRLTAESEKILDIALDCGFGDVSNFNRAFRSEFGINPRAFRSKARAA